MKRNTSSGRVGRPRSFDTDAALDRALRVFWRKGYEGATLSDLTKAVGVNRPSLYAAFGDKEALFRKVLRRKVGIRKGVVQLQAADYLAYEIRKYILDHPKYRAGERKPRGSLGALTGVEVDRKFLSASEIVRLCDAWKLERR